MKNNLILDSNFNDRTFQKIGNYFYWEVISSSDKDPELKCENSIKIKITENTNAVEIEKICNEKFREDSVESLNGR